MIPRIYHFAPIGLALLAAHWLRSPEPNRAATRITGSLVVPSAAATPDGVPSPAVGNVWTMTFDDEFNGVSLDTTKWNYGYSGNIDWCNSGAWIMEPVSGTHYMFNLTSPADGTSASISGSSPPSWPTSGTVGDGNLTWTNKGAEATWSAGHVFSLGQNIIKSVGGTQYVFQVTTAGTSGGTEPAWPYAGFINDGTSPTAVTWENMGKLKSWAASTLFESPFKYCNLDGITKRKVFDGAANVFGANYKEFGGVLTENTGFGMNTGGPDAAHAKFSQRYGYFEVRVKGASSVPGSDPLFFFTIGRSTFYWINNGYGTCSFPHGPSVSPSSRPMAWLEFSTTRSLRDTRRGPGCPLARDADARPRLEKQYADDGGGSRESHGTRDTPGSLR
jgi:hypothetical protein